MTPPFCIKSCIKSMPLHLRKRGAVWHYWRTVPADVRGVLGVSHWRFTLKVRDKLSAESIRAQHDVKYDAMIAEARCLDPAQTMAAIRAQREPGRAPKVATRLPTPSGLTIDRAQARKIKPKAERQHRYTLTDPKGHTENSRKTYLAAEAAALKNAETIVESLSEAEQEIVSNAGGVEELFREARAGRLKIDLQSILAPVAHNEDAEISREVKAARLERREKLLAKLGLLAELPATEEPEGPDNPRLLAAAETYIAENKLRNQTARKHRLHARRLSEFHGNVTMKALTPDMVADFCAAYRELPNGRSTPLKLRSAPMRELLAFRKKNTDFPAYGDGNFNKMLDYLRALFRHFDRDDLLKSCKKVKHVRPFSEKREKPFTPDQLRRIIPLVEERHGTDSDFTWWIYVMLYTGARPEEIAQLRRGDIRINRDRTACSVSITDTDERGVKTAESLRTIPAHPTLIERGLVAFVESRKGSLFPSFEPDADGSLSGNPSERFKTILNNVGVTGYGSAGRLRHTFIDAARNAEISETAQRVLVGHADDSAHGGYGRGVGFKTLQAAIARVDPFLDVLEDTDDA